MGWDPVPWFTEGGAKHSASLARVMANFFTGGQEGVLNALDLRVTELPTPGQGCRIWPGVALIKNRATGHDNEMYVQRMPTSDDSIITTPTSSAGTRSDLVIARVENPYLAGEPWQRPSDDAVANGSAQFIYSRILENVPPGTKDVASLGLNYSAIPLARIDWPPSTATLSQAYVKDLRKVVNPISGIGGTSEAPAADKLWTTSTACPANSRLAANQTAWIPWPTEARWQVPVPSWATKVDCFLMFTPYLLGNSWGGGRIVIDGLAGPAVAFDDNYVTNGPSGGMRTTIMISSSQSIPAGSRNKTVDVHLEAASMGTNHGGLAVGDLLADANTYVYASLNFKQTPVQA